LGKSKTKAEKKLRGDKLRDLILLVYLNNKYGKGSYEIPELKEIVEYSTGGIYSALDYSGYFERTINGIQLTEKGLEYLKNKILPQFSMFYSLGNFLIILGFILLLQWIEWTYVQYPLILPWYSALSIIAFGFFIRFFILRLSYWIIQLRKKMT
jgi:hypothetical protein